MASAEIRRRPYLCPAIFKNEAATNWWSRYVVVVHRATEDQGGATGCATARRWAGIGRRAPVEEGGRRRHLGGIGMAPVSRSGAAQIRRSGNVPGATTRSRPDRRWRLLTPGTSVPAPPPSLQLRNCGELCLSAGRPAQWSTMECASPARWSAPGTASWSQAMGLSQLRKSESASRTIRWPASWANKIKLRSAPGDVMAAQQEFHQSYQVPSSYHAATASSKPKQRQPRCSSIIVITFALLLPNPSAAATHPRP